MKRVRLPIAVAVAALALTIGILAVAFSSTFQTWAARRAIAAEPEWQARIGSVDAGMKRVEVRDVRIEQEGMVLTLPRLDADLSVLSALMSDEVLVSRLVARGWTLDLSKLGRNSAAPGHPANAAPLGPAAVPTAAAQAAGATMQAFAGVFKMLRLPVDLALDGVQLEGTIILPDSQGRANVSLQGGGLGAGREGRFDLVADATLVAPNVDAVTVRGALVAAMETPRTFTQLAVRLDAAASGAQFPTGVTLTAGVTAARAPGGETYSATIVAQDRQVLAVRGDLPRDASRIDGTWKLDVQDRDVAAFTFGTPLPAFTAVGEGKFDADVAFNAVHATGRLSATANRLEALKPELAAIGPIRITADFDLAERGGAIVVQQLEATISAARAVGNLRALQAFEFSPTTGELRAGDPSRDLIGIVLEGVPIAWANPFLSGFEISGGDLRGEFAAVARGGGVALRSRTPITMERLTLTETGGPLMRDVDVNLNVSADYTPQGWQAEITDLSARSGAAQMFALNARAGQLAGEGQPLKATGTLAADLGALMRQPGATRAAALTSGMANVEFVASINEKKEVHAKLAFSDLIATSERASLVLPVIRAELRGDIGTNGRIALNAPIELEREGRKSDVTFVGTIEPEVNTSRAIEAIVTSNHLMLDDAKILGALLSAISERAEPRIQPESGAPPPRDVAPPWAGLHGSLGLQLKKVSYTDTFEMTDVGGRIRIDSGTLKIETVQAALGGVGRAALNGAVNFDPAASQPYQLALDMDVRAFDPGPLLRVLNGDQPAILGGQFDVVSRLSGRAATLGELVSEAGGEFQITSKGGVFRGLPVNAANLVENTSALAGFLATAGSMLGGLTGRKDYIDIANKAQAVGELAEILSAISYDQLSVVVARDESLNTTLKHFALISPELRLTGNGQATHAAGTPLLDDVLAMEFKLRARGRAGELLKYLHALEPKIDDLGYAACTLPLKVGGTLGAPDTTELNRSLAALALEKGGVTDKASDLFNRLMGGGK